MIKKAASIILFISIFIFCLCFSIKAVTNLRPIYYFDINYLNISSISNISKKDIIENYDYVLDYLTDKTSTNNFSLPSLPSSKNAIIHFYEVKKVFKAIDLTFYISLVISVICLLILNKFNTIKIFKWCSISLIAFPLIFVIACIINFDKTFNMFHKLVFNNNYWLFDPKTDPIITILPQAYFLHCSIAIIAITFIEAIILQIISKLLSRFFCAQAPL